MKESRHQKITLTLPRNSILKQNKSQIAIANPSFLENKQYYQKQSQKRFKVQKDFHLNNKLLKYIPYRSLSDNHKYRFRTPSKLILQTKSNITKPFQCAQNSHIKKQIRSSIGLKHLSLINLQTIQKNKTNLNRFRPNLKAPSNDYYITQNPIQQNKHLKIALNNCQIQNRILFKQLVNLKRCLSQSSQTKKRTLSRQSSPYFSRCIPMASNSSIIQKIQKQQLISVKTIKSQSQQVSLANIQQLSKSTISELKLISTIKIQNQSFMKIQSIVSKMEQGLKQIKQMYEISSKEQTNIYQQSSQYA